MKDAEVLLDLTEPLARLAGAVQRKQQRVAILSVQRHERGGRLLGGLDQVGQLRTAPLRGHPLRLQLDRHPERKLS